MAAKEKHASGWDGSTMFMDAEGQLIAIPHTELEKFRASEGQHAYMRKLIKETKDGKSKKSCEETHDTGMTGCPQ